MKFCTLTWTASQVLDLLQLGLTQQNSVERIGFLFSARFGFFLLNNSRSEISFFSHYLYAVVMASNMDVFQPHFPVHSISSTSIVNDVYIVMNIAWMTTFHHLASCCSGRLTSKAASLYLQILRCEKIGSLRVSNEHLVHLSNSDKTTPVPCAVCRAPAPPAPQTGPTNRLKHDFPAQNDNFEV